MSDPGVATASAKSSIRVRLVVPTSTRRAPDWLRTSGIRNPPPISTNSPRDTATSRPSARAARTSRTAEAQLLTTMAASAPQARASRAGARSCREPRVPVSRSNSRVAYRPSPTVVPHGARPRLVWSSTPVALITSVNRARRVSSTRSRARSAAPTGSPLATAARAASTSRGWGRPLSASERARRATLGGRSDGEPGTGSSGVVMRSRG